MDAGVRRGPGQEPVPVRRPLPAQPHEGAQRVPPRRRLHRARREDCSVRSQRGGRFGERGVQGRRRVGRHARVGGLHPVLASSRHAHVQDRDLRLPLVLPPQRARDERDDGVRRVLRGVQASERGQGVLVGSGGLRRQPRRPVRQARRLLRRRMRRQQGQGRHAER